MLNIDLKEIEKALQSQKDNTIVKNMLVDLYKEMGFTAISEEIKNNRNAKQNAIDGLTMYIHDKKADRFNPETREIVWTASEQLIKDLEQFKKVVTSIINNVLRDNTELEKQYLKLKLDYDNVSYRYHEKLALNDTFISSLDRKNSSDWKEQLEVYEKELDILKQAQDKAENALDSFVMNNLDK